MSDQEIIDKAIEIAEKNSGELGWLLGAVFDDLPTLQDFAKALWGEEPDTSTLESYKKYKDRGYIGTGRHGMPIPIEDIGWKHHLQEMVISPDPIKYLKENI